MSAVRDREHDKWIPWYVDDSPGWLELSLAARGAMEGIARKLNDKTGKIILRRGLSSLAAILRCEWAELEPAIAQLIATGKVVWDGSTYTLSDPDYLERKRRGAAGRMAEHRARKRAKPDEEAVTPVTSRASQASPVTGSDGSDGCSSLVLSSLSESGSEPAPEPPNAPLPSIVMLPPGSAPEWFATAIDVVAMNTGVVLPVGEAWLRYDGHRGNKRMPRTQPDAQYWLATVMVPEHRALAAKADSERERTKAFVQQRSGPEVKPMPSVTPLIRERERWEQEAATPEQSAEAAANLRRLLGGVGR